MKKKLRNLIYPVPIAELKEDAMTEFVSSLLGRKIERITLAEVIEAKAELEFLPVTHIAKEDYTLKDGSRMPPAHFWALSHQSEYLSVAAKNDLGPMNFRFLIYDKKTQDEKQVVFSVKDYNVAENWVMLWGIAKEPGGIEKERIFTLYLPEHFFVEDDPYTFKRIRNSYVELISSDRAWKRLRKIILYLSHYMYSSDIEYLKKFYSYILEQPVTKLTPELAADIRMKALVDGEEEKWSKLKQDAFEEAPMRLLCRLIRKATERYIWSFEIDGQTILGFSEDYTLTNDNVLSFNIWTLDEDFEQRRFIGVEYHIAEDVFYLKTSERAKFKAATCIEAGESAKTKKTTLRIINRYLRQCKKYGLTDV